jgi:hypothetical protein
MEAQAQCRPPGEPRTKPEAIDSCAISTVTQDFLAIWINDPMPIQRIRVLVVAKQRRSWPSRRANWR